MRAQHVAADTSCFEWTESSRPQIRRLGFSEYLLPQLSSIKAPGTVEVINTAKRGQSRSIDPEVSGSNNRRSRCQRASSYSQFSAFSSSLQPVQKKNRLKNSLWSNPSAKSQSTQANTSKTLTGRAFSPTPTTPQRDGHMAGGAASC